MSAEVLHGDCRALMAAMEAESVDAIVCDPPYFLGFMNKGWDKANPKALDCDGLPGSRGHGRKPGESSAIARKNSVASYVVHFEWATAALRVARPGTYLLAFGGTRTYHRLACAIEDAGWEICDTLVWLFGSGFPKHKSKLKPAFEPIVMARKPAPRATPLNIDACRLETEEVGRPRRVDEAPYEGTTYGARRPGGSAGSGATDPAGRWPANVLLDEAAAQQLDAQSGEKRSGVAVGGRGNAASIYGTQLEKHDAGDVGYGAIGGASRFFYCAKASRREREAGLSALALQPGGSNAKGFTDDVARGHDRNRPVANHHPTVKPVALMRWLVRLVTPDEGLVLDPFAGSGTTGIAAVLEGRQFIGCEQSAEYVAIARARIAHHATQLTLDAA